MSTKNKQDSFAARSANAGKPSSVAQPLFMKKQNISSGTCAIVTFDIPFLEAHSDALLELSLGPLNLMSSGSQVNSGKKENSKDGTDGCGGILVLPPTFEPSSTSVGKELQLNAGVPKDKMVEPSPSEHIIEGSAVTVYFDVLPKQRATDFRWQEEFSLKELHNYRRFLKSVYTSTGIEKAPTPFDCCARVMRAMLLQPYQLQTRSNLPSSVFLSPSMAVSSGDFANCMPPLFGLSKLPADCVGSTGSIYLAIFANAVPLRNIKLRVVLNVPAISPHDDLVHPWRISRLYQCGGLNHDLVVDWLATNRTKMVLGSERLLDSTPCVVPSVVDDLQGIGSLDKTQGDNRVVVGTGQNLFHVSCAAVGDPRLLKMLAQHCARFVSIEKEDSIFNQTPIMKLLLQANIYSPTEAGTKYFQGVEFLKLLVEGCGALIDVQDVLGNTVTHYAALFHRQGSQILPKLLNEYHAPAAIKNKLGLTPCEFASVFSSWSPVPTQSENLSVPSSSKGQFMSVHLYEVQLLIESRLRQDQQMLSLTMTGGGENVDERPPATNRLTKSKLRSVDSLPTKVHSSVVSQSSNLLLYPPHFIHLDPDGLPVAQPENVRSLDDIPADQIAIVKSHPFSKLLSSSRTTGTIIGTEQLCELENTFISVVKEEGGVQANIDEAHVSRAHILETMSISLNYMKQLCAQMDSMGVPLQGAGGAGSKYDYLERVVTAMGLTGQNGRLNFDDFCILLLRLASR